MALLKAARPDLDPAAEGLLRRIERLERGRQGVGGPRVLSRQGTRAASSRDARCAARTTVPRATRGDRGRGGATSRRACPAIQSPSLCRRVAGRRGREDALAPQSPLRPRQDPRPDSTCPSTRSSRSGPLSSRSCWRRRRRWRRPSRGRGRSGSTTRGCGSAFPPSRPSTSARPRRPTSASRWPRRWTR